MRTLIVLHKEGENPVVVEQGTRKNFVTRLCMDGYAPIATMETELRPRAFLRLIESNKQKEVDSLKETIRDIRSVLWRADE